MNEDIKRFIEPERLSLLKDSDHTQLPDSPLTAQEKSDWATYRQEIRDMTESQSPETVEDVVWPTKPGSI